MKFMRYTTIISKVVTLFVLSLLTFASPSVASVQTTHLINFGNAFGSYGNRYSPSNITVEVGDTIIWKGDFSIHNMVATSLPAGANPIGTVSSGMSYTYIVEASGNYFLENPIWAGLGMKDTIIAVFKSHGSITNEGREFYLGCLYPTYNNVATSNQVANFHIYALITTYYDNEIFYTYYDQNGQLLTPTRKLVSAKQRLQIKLDLGSMRADSFPEAQVYKACHITSKYPISVQYLSNGANSGGSYLALPVLGLGKNYVIASYNDNAGNGAIYNQYGLPKNYDVAGGDFMIIATEDVTGVNITPATTTSGGKVKGSPFSIGLSKGQCYFVRSDGLNADHDISGTVIQSTKPIVVISGHEDGYLGDISGTTSEGRDLMIEQMVPVEYWDSVGYLGVPCVEGNPAAAGGHGDAYRVYTNDNKNLKVQADVVGISGGYDMTPSFLNLSEKTDITNPVNIYNSINGHKISVIQYDERSQPPKKPYPAPSMMTIIPHSRWRTSYNFSEFDPGGISGVNESQYINIISDSLTSIRVSADGSAEVPLGSTGFTSVGTIKSLPSSYGVKGGSYSVNSHAFYLHSDFPFIAYGYGMSESFDGAFPVYYPFESEYASPLGMQLNTGIPPSFKISIDTLSKCVGWTIHVTDTSTNNPGIKAVMLVDDTAGVYFQRPGIKFRNVAFDSSSADFKMGEIHANSEANNPYSFDIKIPNRLGEAFAPIGIIDNNGNGLLIQLHRNAPALQLSTTPPTAKPDSIFFPSGVVGSQICTTFVVKNTAPTGGSPLTFISANLTHPDAAYSIQSVTPSLPATIPAQGTLTINLCYTSKDLLRHQDTLVINNDCFTLPISLDGHSSTGLITAEDIAFGSIDSGKEVCKTLLVHNIGSAAFTLKSAAIADKTNFAIDAAFLATLPVSIPKGGQVSVKVCYHPQKAGDDTTAIIWTTDIDASFINTTKSYSGLSGTGLDTVTHNGRVAGADRISNTFSVRPNPATGNSAKVSFSLPEKSKANLVVYDVLGREMFSMNLRKGAGDVELPLTYLKQGIYYVRLISDDIVLTQKLEVVR